MDPMDFRRRLTEEIPPDQMMEPPAPPQGQQAPPIDIRAYLMDKYKMQGGPSAEVPEAAGRGQQFLAALGAGLQGRDQSAAVAALDSGRNQALAEQDSDLKRMMAFDKLKKDDQVFDRETGEFEKQQAKKASMADPSSDYSKFAQQLAMGMGYQGDPSTLSAEQFSSFSPFFKQKLEQENKAQDREYQAKRDDQMFGLQRENASATRNLAKQREEDRKLEILEKKEEKKQIEIDSLTTPFGQALTKDDAKQLKSAYESKGKFDIRVKEMIELRQKHKGGTFFNREDVDRGKQLSKDLLLQYKDMAKLGVLSQADEKILNAIIPPDPLAYDFIPGQDPIMNNLIKFQEDSNTDFKNRVSTRIKAGAQTRPAVEGDTGMVTVSNGKETMQIESSDLRDAEADGFKVIK